MDAMEKRKAIFERTISNFCTLVNIHVARWSERGLVEVVPNGNFYEALFREDAGEVGRYCPSLPVAVGLVKELTKAFEKNRVALCYYTAPFLFDFTKIVRGELSPDYGKIRGFFLSDYTPKFAPFKTERRRGKEERGKAPLFVATNRKQREGEIIKSVRDIENDKIRRVAITRGGLYGEALNGNGPIVRNVTARLLIVAKTLYALLGELEEQADDTTGRTGQSLNGRPRQAEQVEAEQDDQDRLNGLRLNRTTTTG